MSPSWNREDLAAHTLDGKIMQCNVEEGCRQEKAGSTCKISSFITRFMSHKYRPVRMQPELSCFFFYIQREHRSSAAATANTSRWGVLLCFKSYPTMPVGLPFTQLLARLDFQGEPVAVCRFVSRSNASWHVFRLSLPRSQQRAPRSWVRTTTTTTN